MNTNLEARNVSMALAKLKFLFSVTSSLSVSEHANQTIFDTFAKLSPVIEPLSIFSP